MGRDSGTSSTAIGVTKAIGASNLSSTATKSEPSNSSYPSSDNETGEKYINIFLSFLSEGGVLAVPRGHALGEGNAWISKLSLNAFRELLFSSMR